MRITRFLLATCALISFQAGAVAATLQVKVNEVHSGNTLLVSNTSRSLKVRLKGIAPPEAGQPFSDVAREHLSVLVLNKAVLLEYSNLSDGYLEARISLNGIDVGSQMLRDGVAWYDRRHDYGLSAADRELYARCEQAARNEKRGLWADANAIAPWEFGKANTAKVPKESKPVSFSAHQAAAAKRAAASRTLTNRYLGRGDVEAGDIAGQPTIRLVDPNAAPDDWITYKSATPRFTIRVPGNSSYYDYPILDSDMKIANMSYVIGLSDGAVYVLMWSKLADVPGSDAVIADEMLGGWIKGLNHYFAAKGLPYTASFSSGRPIRIGGYSGKQYSVSAGGLSGFARAFSRRILDRREVFTLAVFSRTADESAFDFLNSLKFLETRK